MPPLRPAAEARSGSFEPGRPSRTRSANTQSPSLPAAHAARRPDVRDRRQTASSLNAPRVGHNKLTETKNTSHSYRHRPMHSPFCFVTELVNELLNFEVKQSLSFVDTDTDCCANSQQV